MMPVLKLKSNFLALAVFLEEVGQVLDAGPANIKVTTPFDLTVADAVLALRSAG